MNQTNSEIPASLAGSPPATPTPTIQAIQAVVANLAGLPIESMTAESQRRVHVRPRWVAMYIAHSRYGYSQGQVGRRFRRDHTTVAYAVEQMERLKQDGEVRDLLDRAIHALERRA